MARVNWAGLLNLQGLAGRWRSAMGEGATAVEDRMELARLEWADHKRRLALLALLLVVFGVLAVVALLLLSAAVLVQFWDTSQRALAAWLLAGLWLVACGVRPVARCWCCCCPWRARRTARLRSRAASWRRTGA